MRNVALVVVFNIILLEHVAQFENFTEFIGPVQLQAKIKTLPEKYAKLNENDKKASGKIVDLAEKLRKIFPTGFRSLPPLDPWRREKFKAINFNLPNLWLQGKLYLKNFEMTGIQNFTLESIEMRLNSLRSDLEVFIPLLYSETDFEVEATLAFLPMKLSGHIRCILKGLNISGAVGAEKKLILIRSIFQLKSADINAHADSIQVHVSNLNFGDGVDGVGKDFSIARWINSMKDDAALAVVVEVFKTINRGLRGFNADRVIAFLLSNS